MQSSRASSRSIATSSASRSRRCNCRMYFEVASTGAAATRRLVIPPGSTLGLLGGGQLGRMFTVAARTLGYRVTVLDPDPASPAAEFATGHLNTAYGDPGSLDALARTCAAVTT